MAPNLIGKVCLVTGASRGIGRGIALQLGQAGATVYVTGRHQPTLEACIQEIKERGAKEAIPLQGVSDLNFFPNRNFNGLVISIKKISDFPIFMFPFYQLTIQMTKKWNKFLRK